MVDNENNQLLVRRTVTCQMQSHFMPHAYSLTVISATCCKQRE
jgi:hypothetical protein